MVRWMAGSANSPNTVYADDMTVPFVEDPHPRFHLHPRWHGNDFLCVYPAKPERPNWEVQRGYAEQAPASERHIQEFFICCW